MLFRRVSIPIVMILTLFLQFVPGTVFAPSPVAASSCDVAQFVSDVTIPDGTNIAPGTTFVKTWRLKNIGSCTWTTSYSAVFTGGDQMGAPAVIALPYSVAPGATVDITVNLTSPTGNGHYRGNWKLRNASGGIFGVGASGSYVFWVDIYVNSSSTTGTTYDFVSNYCSALWASGAGGLGCPGTDGNANGFVIKVDAPQLETGSVATMPGLVVNPQQVVGGWIKGYYPAYTVHSGDHFQSIINCAYNAPNCYVNFRLEYQVGGGSVNTFWSFNERYDGLYYPVNLDLSSLAGQSVNFILYTADVSGHGTPSGDRATWVGPRITGAGGAVVPVPPSSTCDKGAFVQDTTIPDGTTLAPGSAFTKTWRIRNVGSCTWTTDYALVFAFGNQMGGVSPTNLPSSVAPVIPGATADFSVNLVAPSTPGHYRSYWRFRNAAGNQFGVGSGMITFFADIYVSSSGGNSTTTTITADAPDPSNSGQAVTVSVVVTGGGSTPTGTVSISGADSNCTLGLSGGAGSCNVVFNTTGSKTLIATYNGDSNHASSSGSVSHTVTPISSNTSTTTITSDNPDASTPGQAVAVAVTVAGAGTTPTGTVAISGADTNCTITLSGGSGTCNVVFNSAGGKTLTAVYSGDGNYGSSSDSESHNVSKGSTTTTITSDTPDPSNLGQSVPVSVTVSGAGATPTGTVAITGADTNCTITLSGGNGSCDAIFNNSGGKTLTATYSGDGNYNGSSDTESHTVTSMSNSTTKITADTPDPSVPGAVVDVDVAVVGAGTYPTGTVAITGADTNCTITLAADATGSCSVIFNSDGAKTLTATYSGNSNYAASSANVSHSVSTGKAASATTITSNVPDPSIPGQAVAVSVTVSGAGLPVPTGNVDITGADSNCSILLANGTGSCSVVFNSTGHKTIKATYSGDVKYAPSSGTIGHIVIMGSTTTNINVVTPNPALVTQPVEVEFSVIGGGVTPTGTVAITGADVNCSITLSGANGSCKVIFNTIGTKSLTAVYSGDANYLPSTSTPVTVTVLNSTTTKITSDIANPSLPGDSVLVTVTVSGPGVAPTGTVDITGADTNCTLGLAGGTGSCSVIFNTAGAKLLTATYNGDVNYVGSVGTKSHTVNKGVSTIVINSDTPDPSAPNALVTVTVTVTGAVATPTGTVGISISGQPSTCTVTLVAGTGSCSVVFTATGNYTITATYSGDGNYLPSVITEPHTVS